MEINNLVSYADWQGLSLNPRPMKSTKMILPNNCFNFGKIGRKLCFCSLRNHIEISLEYSIDDVGKPCNNTTRHFWKHVNEFLTRQTFFFDFVCPVATLFWVGRQLWKFANRLNQVNWTIIHQKKRKANPIARHVKNFFTCVNIRRQLLTYMFPKTWVFFLGCAFPLMLISFNVQTLS